MVQVVANFTSLIQTAGDVDRLKEKCNMTAACYKALTFGSATIDVITTVDEDIRGQVYHLAYCSTDLTILPT